MSPFRRLREVVGASAHGTKGVQYADEVHPALRAYLRKLDEKGSGYEPSVFWQRQLECLEDRYVGIGEATAADLEALGREGSYAFEPLPDGIAHPAKDPEYRHLLEVLPGAHQQGKALARGPGLEKRQVEHLRAIHFLTARKLLSQYLAFLAPLGLRSSMSAARHWYYAREICLLADEHLESGGLDVLEIGGGAGNLAYFLILMGRVRSYCIIDLPEMLVHSAFALQRMLPQPKLSFAALAEPGSGDQPPLSFFRPQEVDALPDRCFDLCVNLNSFMEMDEQARDGYLDLVYRTSRPGALFYNVNRRQRALPLADGGTWDNNPLLYPYRADDRVLRWEEDDFQTVTRADWGVAPALTVTRAALVRAPTAR